MKNDFSGYWKIIKAEDLEGNKKQIPEKREERTYQILHLEEGSSAQLIDFESGMMISSIVKDVNIYENNIDFLTINTKYFLEKQ